MSSNDAKQFNETAIDFQTKVINNRIWNCCWNCKFFDRNKEICNTYKQRPPAIVITVGCKDHFPQIGK